MNDLEHKKSQINKISRLIEVATENAVLSSKADSFERQALAYLMEQYVKLAPKRPLLVGGKKSLLLELWKTRRVEEALLWEELAGRTAWISTPDEGSLLAKIMGLIIDNTLSSWAKRGLEWPVSSVDPKLKVETLTHFLVRGLEYAMPYKPGDSCACANDQNTVLAFCQEDDNLMTGRQKLGLFKNAGGVLCLGSTLRGRAPNWQAYINAGLVEADTQVYWISGNKVQQIHWTQAWKRSWQSPQEVFAHMERLGLDARPFKIEKMRHDLGLVKSWDQAKEVLNNTPGGWEYEEDGVLRWQKLLADHPEFLVGMVKDIPRARLRQKSSAGRGIWDQVLDGWENKNAVMSSTMQVGCIGMPGYNEVADLLKAVPLDTARGQIFRASNTRHHVMDRLFEDTHKHNPRFWVGDKDDNQVMGAREILLNLLYNQSKKNNVNTREVWAQNANRLNAVYQHNPQALTAPTRAVLWCLSQFLEQYPGKLDTDVSYLAGNNHIPEPRAGEMDWAKDLIEYDRYKPHPTVDILKKVLVRGSLLAQANGSHIHRAETSPKPKI